MSCDAVTIFSFFSFSYNIREEIGRKSLQCTLSCEALTRQSQRRGSFFYPFSSITNPIWRLFLIKYFLGWIRYRSIIVASWLGDYSCSKRWSLNQTMISSLLFRWQRSTQYRKTCQSSCTSAPEKGNYHFFCDLGGWTGLSCILLIFFDRKQHVSFFNYHQ